MTQERANSSQNNSGGRSHKAGVATHYTLLGLHPSASAREIRQAYRDLSKLYHPDTTELPAAIATEKFRQLNEAYATLSNVDRRQSYDQKIGYSKVIVSQPLPNLSQPQPKSSYSSSAYLDPTDRPLSPGELFALFILGLTFIACLILAVAIGLTRGEKAFQPLSTQHSMPTESQRAETGIPQDLQDNNPNDQAVKDAEIKPAQRFPFVPVKAPKIKSSPESQQPTPKKDLESTQETKADTENVSASTSTTPFKSTQETPNQETIEEVKPILRASQPAEVQSAPEVVEQPSTSASSVSIDSSNSAL